MRSANDWRTWASVKPQVTSGHVSFAMITRQGSGAFSARMWSAGMAPVERTRASARVFTGLVQLHFENGVFGAARRQRRSGTEGAFGRVGVAFMPRSEE